MKSRVLLLSSLCLISFSSHANSKGHTGEILFKVKKSQNKFSLNSIYSKYGINNKTTYSNGIVNVFTPSDKSQNIENIKQEMLDSGAFEFVEFNTFEHEIGNETPLTDPKAKKQYHHSLVETQLAWTITQGEGAVVAVCDSGVETQHEDLKANILSEGAWDFIDNDGHANPATSHGTFVAGLIAASANNGVGGAGMAPKAKILPLRIATTKGGTTIKTIAECIKYAADKNADIINVSFTGVNSDTVNAAGEYAFQKGSLLIYSAGNQGDNTKWKDRKHVMAIGGSNANDTLWRVKKCKWGVICYGVGSNAGDFVDIVTPGHNIFSTTTYIEHNTGKPKYRSGSGTSYSAPILSGIAALIVSIRPDLGPLEIEHILETTADKIGSGDEYYYGAGRANAFEAVKRALDY